MHNHYGKLRNSVVSPLLCINVATNINDSKKIVSYFKCLGATRALKFDNAKSIV